MATTYDDFLAALRMREASGSYTLVNTLGFLGAYQFGEAALADLGFVNLDSNPSNNDFSGGWTGKLGINSAAEFLATPWAQDAAADEWFPLIWRYLTAIDADAWLGQTVAGVQISASGLLAGAHLLGAGKVLDWLESGGTLALTDAYGTPIAEYIGLFSGYTMPFDTGETLTNEVAEIVAALPDAIEALVDAAFSNDPTVLLGADGTNDTLDGTETNDFVYGGAGADTLSAGGGADVLIGGTDGDRLIAGNGHDLAVGGGGDDTLKGYAGTDRLYGNTGRDILRGGLGEDRLVGGRGRDDLYGGDDDDVVIGGVGNDNLTGGTGADIFVFYNGSDADQVLDFSLTEGDRVRLTNATAITSYTDLVRNHADQVGKDVVIDARNGDVLTLENVQLSALDAGDFIF